MSWYSSWYGKEKVDGSYINLSTSLITGMIYSLITVLKEWRVGERWCSAARMRAISSHFPSIHKSFYCTHRHPVQHVRCLLGWLRIPNSFNGLLGRYVVASYCLLRKILNDIIHLQQNDESSLSRLTVLEKDWRDDSLRDHQNSPFGCPKILKNISSGWCFFSWLIEKLFKAATIRHLYSTTHSVNNRLIFNWHCRDQVQVRAIYSLLFFLLVVGGRSLVTAVCSDLLFRNNS